MNGASDLANSGGVPRRPIVEFVTLAGWVLIAFGPLLQGGAWALLAAADRGWIDLSTGAADFIGFWLAPARTSATLAFALLGACALQLVHWRSSRQHGPALMSVSLLLIWVGVLNSAMLKQARADSLRSTAVVERLGDRVYWCGGISFESAVLVVRHLLYSDAQPSALVLRNNAGGFTVAAKAVVDALDKAGTPVEVSGLCASACAAVWFGAPERALRRDSIIAVHGSTRNIWGTVVPTASDDVDVLDRMVRAGMREHDAKAMLSLYGTSAAWLGGARLRDLGVAFEELPWHPSDAVACDNSSRPAVELGPERDLQS